MPGFGRKVINRNSVEKRRAVRSRAIAPAIVETPATREPVTVIDISVSGARIVGSKSAPGRQDVKLKLSGLALFGIIAWRDNNSFGIKFDEALRDSGAAEIEQAVRDAKVGVLPFDREAALQELANKTSSPDRATTTTRSAENAPDVGTRPEQ